MGDFVREGLTYYIMGGCPSIVYSFEAFQALDQFEEVGKPKG